ncbi:hypothetical protein AA313_de0207192 [Arthrobotrys entomopaga]|nr:hypothetical protein AA313_de0207192 [Arthrobotrys entomopaga]
MADTNPSNATESPLVHYSSVKVGRAELGIPRTNAIGDTPDDILWDGIRLAVRSILSEFGGRRPTEAERLRITPAIITSEPLASLCKEQGKDPGMFVPWLINILTRNQAVARQPKTPKKLRRTGANTPSEAGRISIPRILNPSSESDMANSPEADSSKGLLL